MKKTLYLLIVSILFLGNMGFASADPIIHGTIDGVTEIDVPMEEVPEPCVEADYTYSDWSICHINRTQTRTAILNNGRCVGGFVPQFSDLTQTCTLHLGVGEIELPPAEEVPEPCVEADYVYTSNWSDCRPDNTQIRTSQKINTRCEGGFEPNLIQSCTYSINIPGGNIGGGGGTYFIPTVNPVQQVLGEKIGEDRWIKTPNSSTVYMLDDNNIRHAYPHEKIWYSYFDKDFSFVETITEEQLTSYTLGKNVQFKAGSLIKIPSVPKVYLVGENFLIQWIKTEDTAIRLYGADWNKLVYDLDEAFFDDYVLGGDIE